MDDNDQILQCIDVVALVVCGGKIIHVLMERHEESEHDALFLFFPKKKSYNFFFFQK